MLTRLTYKYKFFVLIVFIMLASILIYRMAISKTIDKYGQCNKLKIDLEMINDAPQRIANIQIKLKRIENVIGSIDPTIQNQEAIFELVSNYCNQNHATLIEISNPVLTEKGDFLIETHRIELEGSFIKLNRFIYLLEQKYNIGHVVSVRFQTKQNRKTKRVRLHATVYIQNIKSMNDEI